jgi:hypothetical protein
VTHPLDPDAPHTEESPASRDDNDERPARPADAGATAPDDEAQQRPVYEPYDPTQRHEPAPPHDSEPLPTYDSPWSAMDDTAWPRRP